MGICQFGQRKSGRTHIEALHIEGSLDRDRIDLNEELVDQGKGLELELFGLLVSALQAVHDKVMRLTGRNIGKDGNDTRAAQGTEGHDLVIVAGINIDLSVNEAGQFGHLADIAGRFLDCCDVGLVLDKSGHGLGQDIGSRPGRNVVDDAGELCR